MQNERMVELDVFVVLAVHIKTFPSRKIRTSQVNRRRFFWPALMPLPLYVLFVN